VLAQVLAGAFFDEDVDQRRHGADRPAEQGAAHDPGPRIDGISGQMAIERRQHRDVLEWVDDVDKVGKAETVVAKQRERLVVAGRSHRSAVGRRQHRKLGRRGGSKTAHVQSFSRSFFALLLLTPNTQGTCHIKTSEIQ